MLTYPNIAETLFAMVRPDDDEHRRTSHAPWGDGQLVNEGTDAQAALAELRKRLSDGLASAELTKTQLATQAGLGRTTVQEAFKDGGPPPSSATVGRLARVLRLPAHELQDLRRTAAANGLAGGRVTLPPAAPVAWAEGDREKLIDELTRVMGRKKLGRTVLDAIGFPAHILPSELDGTAAHPRIFWELVVRHLESGVVEAGLARFVNRVWHEYPYNGTLAGLAVKFPETWRPR
ncbi:helix-turn-helix domain-containing protein [Streptomyces sp. DT193]|uniref:helix-turn-helix domain-containing protein n=1 Tax=Streptomyces sp. DT193 TaxID=3393418 RepID=UPI003CF63A6B